MTPVPTYLWTCQPVSTMMVTVDDTVSTTTCRFRDLVGSRISVQLEIPDHFSEPARGRAFGI